MTQRSDAEVLEGLRAQEPWARTALVDRYGHEIERVVRHLLGKLGTEHADVVHDAFLQAFRSAHHLRDPSAMRAWLRSIATHTAWRTIRSRRRRRWLVYLQPEEVPELVQDPTWEAHEACQRTYRVLRDLPSEEQVVFALRYVDGCEVGEIAALCGISLSTTKRRLRRAETRFAQAAQRDPVLVQWLEQGVRWTR